MLEGPSEISLGWAYIPPVMLDVLFGLACAWIVTAVLNATRLSRFFVHPPLSFVALWVLATSLIGLFVLPP